MGHGWLRGWTCSGNPRDVREGGCDRGSDCSPLPQRLPHAVRSRDDALADAELAAHENERASAAHDTACRLDEFADLHRVDEMHIEMHGRLRLLVVRIPR